MQVEIRAVLYDIQQAVSLIEEFTLDAEFTDYQNNAMMRSAVERQFEIIGEAVNRLSEMNADLASRIRERPRIISFRNQLIHGYFVVGRSGGLGCNSDETSDSCARYQGRCRRRLKRTDDH